jgi:hypothetical protein
MSDTTVKKVSSATAPKGEMGNWSRGAASGRSDPLTMAA